MVDIGTGLLGVGAGLSLGLAALGAGIGEREALASSIAAIMEKPEMFGKALLFSVIPETLVIFGLVIAIMLLQTGA